MTKIGDQPDDRPRYHVEINGKLMRPSVGTPYEFTWVMAEREANCTELRNKVQCENIRIISVGSR